MKKARKTSALVLGWLLLASAVVLPLVPREADAHYNALNVTRTGAACAALPDTQILDCWLGNHPAVALQINWYFPNQQPSIVSYPSWPAWLKSELNTEWDLAMKYYGWQIAGPLQRFPEPIPKGVYDPKYSDAYTTMDPNIAKAVYLSFVANALATEMSNAFGWSIAPYSATQLAELLNYNKLVQYSGSGQYAGWYRTTNESPKNATALVRFFWNSVGQTNDPEAAIGSMIEWSHQLTHVFSAPGEVGWPPESDFFGPDAPPGTYTQMIDGTPYQGPDIPSQGMMGHWTYGCGGTTDFLIHVLKAINLPVKRVYAGSVSPVCLHNTPYFMTIDKYLSHGDDPYDRTAANDPPLPGTEFLISAAKFNTWFPPKAQDPNGDICSANVGRRPMELALQYLPTGFLEMYCEDRSSRTPRKKGQIYQSLSAVYTMKELNQMKLWPKLAAKAKALNLPHCKPGQ